MLWLGNFFFVFGLGWFIVSLAMLALNIIARFHLPTRQGLNARIRQPKRWARDACLSGLAASFGAWLKAPPPPEEIETIAIFLLFGGVPAVAIGTVAVVINAIRKKKERGKLWLSITGSGWAALVLGTLMLAAFQTSPEPTPKGVINLGSKVKLAEKNISPSGGTIIVDKPGDPLNGLQIKVPANAYGDSRTFKVSSAPVKSHTFGRNFNPISPLVSIESGGGYSNELMLVKIPVEIPEGDFAMAFFYDEKSGQLEAMPLVALGQNSVTVATRHFSNGVVSSMGKERLDKLAKEVDTGFRPGVDDWQFRNEGSYITPRGECSGQSITAMWYYYEKTTKEKAKHLYGLFNNNTPQLWQDDALAYRFVSRVQLDFNWRNVDLSITNLDTVGIGSMGIGRLSGGREEDDETIYRVFLYSMLLLRQPQFVGVLESSTNTQHAMVVYRASPGKLYVADPNYPGNDNRTIPFSSGKFGTYDSLDGSESPPRTIKYDTFFYFARTALIDWDTIASRWAEFQAGTIGSDKFPAYKLEATDDAGKTYNLTDGLTVNSETLTVQAKGPIQLRTALYRDGAWVLNENKRIPLESKTRIQLKKGPNRLGIWILGPAPTDKWRWFDFKWVNVSYGPTPTPVVTTKPDLTVTSVTFSPSSGEVGQKLSVSFTIKNQGASASGPFSNRISLATTRWGTDYSLGSFEMASLASGEERKVSVTTQAVPTAAADGSYWVTVFADGLEKIDESNEGNNIGSAGPANIAALVKRTPVNVYDITLTISAKAHYENRGVGFPDHHIVTDETVNATVSFPNIREGREVKLTMAEGKKFTEKGATEFQYSGSRVMQYKNDRRQVVTDNGQGSFKGALDDFNITGAYALGTASSPSIRWEAGGVTNFGTGNYAPEKEFPNKFVANYGPRYIIYSVARDLLTKGFIGTYEYDYNAGFLLNRLFNPTGDTMSFKNRINFSKLRDVRIHGVLFFDAPGYIEYSGTMTLKLVRTE